MRTSVGLPVQSLSLCLSVLLFFLVLYSIHVSVLDRCLDTAAAAVTAASTLHSSSASVVAVFAAAASASAAFAVAAVAAAAAGGCLQGRGAAGLAEGPDTEGRSPASSDL